MKERALIDALKRGNERAFDKLYEMYYRLVYYIISKYINDIRIIEELVNDVFMKVYTSIDSFDNSKPFKVWISIIAKNTAINSYNRLKKENVIYSDEYINSLPQEYKNSIEIEEFLNKFLDDEEKSIVERIVFFDYKFKEVAIEMGLNQSYIQTKYYRAIKKLKNNWKEYKSL